MRLVYRLVFAMAGVALFAVAVTGAIAYREFRETAEPRALERIGTRAQLAAERLAASVGNAAADVAGFRSAVALDGIVRASLAGGDDPQSDLSVKDWSDRLAQRFVAELAAKPAYQQFRVIAAADGGREILRVDRSGPQGAIRVVPDAELQRKGDTDYFRRAIALADGEIDISPVELNRERGVVETPHVPQFRAATPIDGPGGERFGIVVINVGVAAAFDRVLRSAPPGARRFVVNERGDFLAHPDASRTFAFEFGLAVRAQQDFPDLAPMLQAKADAAREIRDARGEPFAVALAWSQISGGPVVGVVDAEPAAQAFLVTQAIREAVTYAMVVAVLGAVALAVAIALPLTRPLAQMTRAALALGRGEPMSAPVNAGGEIGVLARAFARMEGDIKVQTEAVRHHEQLLDRIIGNIADGVLVIDTNRKTVLANPACKALLGDYDEYGSPEWSRIYKRFRPDGVTPLPLENTLIVRASRGESFDNVEGVMRREGDPTTYRIVASARPLRDAAGRLEGAVIVYHDVTQLREIERQLQHSQRMDAVGQLTGGVAHDFNNILTVIMGMTEMLIADAAGQPKLVDGLRTIEQAATRAAALTAHLLAFARRQVLEPRPTDVNALVVESLALLRPALGEHIAIETMLTDGLAPAQIDPSQLSNALLNLGVNARDAMPEGGKLTIETDDILLDQAYCAANAEVAPGRYLMVAVSDTGAGIPAAIRDRVFEPFFTTKEAGKGTGLGLSMVYGFIKQSGGHVKIYSEEGVGTTIRLYLPYADRAERAADARPPAGSPAGGNETILVVEDDDLVRGSVVGQVEKLGYRVLAAANGPAALALVEQGVAFDLLFTDVVMPGSMTGRQLADAVAKLRPGIKVLFTSGYTQNAIVHHGRLDAHVTFLGKPYRTAALAQKLREALDG